jgi:hypothetical protein
LGGEAVLGDLGQQVGIDRLLGIEAVEAVSVGEREVVAAVAQLFDGVGVPADGGDQRGRVAEAVASVYWASGP